MFVFKLNCRKWTNSVEHLFNVKHEPQMTEPTKIKIKHLEKENIEGKCKTLLFEDNFFYHFKIQLS